MTYIDTMRQALEALIAAQNIMGFGKEWDKTEAAIDALHLAIEQAEKREPLNLNCKSVQKRLATQWGYVVE